MSTKQPSYAPLSLTKALHPQVEETDYQGLQSYIDSIAAMARLTYKSLYIIDYNRMNFLYVSNNPLFLCGKTAEEVMREGYSFYYNHVPKQDFDFLNTVNRVGFEFLSQIPVLDRVKYTVSYNFHLNCATSVGKMLINHRITPLKLSIDGNVWLALCVVDLAASKEMHVPYMTDTSSGCMWRYSKENGYWQLCPTVELSEYEKDVVRLAYQGSSVSEMAETIHRSDDSIKGYRKSLFSKLGVTNISEAIAAAILRRLI